MSPPFAASSNTRYTSGASARSISNTVVRFPLAFVFGVVFVPIADRALRRFSLPSIARSRLTVLTCSPTSAAICGLVFRFAISSTARCFLASRSTLESAVITTSMRTLESVDRSNQPAARTSRPPSQPTTRTRPKQTAALTRRRTCIRGFRSFLRSFSRLWRLAPDPVRVRSPGRRSDSFLTVVAVPSSRLFGSSTPRLPQTLPATLYRALSRGFGRKQANCSLFMVSEMRAF